MRRVSSSCFVLASVVSVPVEMGVEVASASRELGLDQLLLTHVPVGRGYPQFSLLPLLCWVIA